MIPILYLAPVDWCSIRQRPQQLALRLAEQFDLRYVDAVGLRSARLSDARRICRRAVGSTVGSAPFPVLAPRYVPLFGSRLLNRLNCGWLARQARAWLDGFTGPWILWTATPSLLAEVLTERAEPSLVVYDCMDRYAAFHRGAARARIERAERRIVDRADLVFATSQVLAERLRSTGATVSLVPNGVDDRAFATTRRGRPPGWMHGVKGPVIGCHGTIGDWLDFDLLEELARRRPQWTLVLIGPRASRRARRLEWRPNVRVLPAVPYHDLPAQLAWFDVGIVPFALNEITTAVHPIKALEYLAAGLPVVSAPLAGLADVSSVVRFAEGVAGWIDSLERSLDPRSRSDDQLQARRAAARERSWDRTAVAITNRLNAALRSSARFDGADCRQTGATLDSSGRFNLTLSNAGNL